MAVPGGDAWAEIDGRILYDVQTSEWRDALEIEAPASSPSQDNFDVYWVHAIAAAQLGKLAVARESLRELSESIAHQKSGTDYADTLHLYLLQAQAAVESAAGQSDKAVATLESAVAFEQEHPVDYPNVLAPPSAECLGTLFLQLHRPHDALQAFRQALAMAPRTLHSVRGVTRF
jgi:tetratricopeptide (TPR) repeat protein